MKIMITGGAGFIGLHLTNLLLEEGHEVHLIDNFERAVEDKDLTLALSHKNSKLIKLDLLNKDEYKYLDDNYDYIFHLAAIIGVQHVLNRPYEVLTKNVELLSNIIDLCKSQKNLKRLMFASTSEIYAGTLKYGNLEIPTPETSTLTLTDLEEARTSYLLSKIYGEAMCQHSNVPFTIFRPHNFYGPRMGMSHVIPEMLKKAYTNSTTEEIIAYSSEHTRTFCYIKDAINIIWELARTEDSLNQYYNIGNQSPEITIHNLAKEVVNTVGRNVPVIPGEDTPGSPTRRCPNISKVSSIVEYNFQYDLQKGIQETFEWYRNNVFDNNGVTAK